MHVLAIKHIMKFFRAFNYSYMPVLGLLPLQCYCVFIYCTHSVCRSYFMVLKQSLCLMLIFELCMLLGKLLCIKFLNWIMMLICSILYCFGVLPINFVLDLRNLCFLSKQRCHSISVHNVFYDIFGFSEFNRLFSVYSVCGQSRGYFIASVLDVFRDLAFWLLYWLYCFSSGLSVCLYTLLCE